MPLKMRLSGLPQLPPPVLTAYIDVNPGNPRNQGSRGYLTWLRSTGQALVKELPRNAQAAFRSELKRIETFLITERPRCRALVVLAGPNVWDVVPLQVDVSEELHWGKPSLQQMTWVLDEHRPRGVVLIDGSGARFFQFWLGLVAEDESQAYSVDISSWRRPHLVGPSTAGVAKQSGTQRDRVQDRLDVHRNRFLQAIAGRIESWAIAHEMDHVLLVGASADIDAAMDALPMRFRKRTMVIPKTFSHATTSDIKQRLQPVLEKWERDYEDELVEQIISSADDPRKSAMGLDRVLAELQQGRVRELIVARGVSGAVRECLKCGWIDASADAVCAKCGAQRRPRSLRTVIPELAGVHAVPVEVVAGKAARKLEKVGKLAAWLGASTRSS